VKVGLLGPISVAMLILSVAACSGQSGGPAPTNGPGLVPSPALPPRPADLSVDGINPCDLLTEAQYRGLGLNTGTPVPDSGSGSPTSGEGCLWTNFPDRPDNAWGAVVLPHTGADYAMGGDPIRFVDGFAATTGGTAGTDQDHYCAMLVDVAPHQALMVTYANNRKDVPGLTHRIACDKTQQAAELMVPILRSIQHR
jgi:hypothetical protein